MEALLILVPVGIWLLAGYLQPKPCPCQQCAPFRDALESGVQAAVKPDGDTMKFKLLDGHDNDVLGGEVDVDNPFITQYGALVDGPAPRKLEVGQSCQQRYSMSGQKPTVYRVLRVS